jgi:hypothetical protein
VLTAEALAAARRDCAALVADGTFADTDQHDARVRSDQVVFVTDRHDPHGLWWWLYGARTDGLLGVLRTVRSFARSLETHGAQLDNNNSNFINNSKQRHNSQLEPRYVEQHAGMAQLEHAGPSTPIEHAGTAPIEHAGTSWKGLGGSGLGVPRSAQVTY